MKENNIYCLLKVLNYNIRFLNDLDDQEEFKASAPNAKPQSSAANASSLAIKTTSEKIPTPEFMH